MYEKNRSRHIWNDCQLFVSFGSFCQPDIIIKTCIELWLSSSILWVDGYSKKFVSPSCRFKCVTRDNTLTLRATNDVLSRDEDISVFQENRRDLYQSNQKKSFTEVEDLSEPWEATTLTLRRQDITKRVHEKKPMESYGISKRLFIFLIYFVRVVHMTNKYYQHYL